VSFEVPDGAFMVVIGLSGSGKSTLLRCINRLVVRVKGVLRGMALILPLPKATSYA
jgi:phosphonate transport system ATP-binding protein